MSTEYVKTYDVRWADLDVNFHMRHTAFNDYCAQVRLNFLQDRGLTLEKMRELNLGPVLFTEYTDFMKEVRPGDTIQVNLKIAAMTPDGRKWKMRHEVFRGDGKKAAVINVSGAWFDTAKRSVVAPPLMMQRMFLDLPKTDDFSENI
jgi:acyl-CoA thioester hydrolase